MNLNDPSTFASVYDEHAAGVYGAALRVLGDPAQAQDVAQDVFLKLWRRPERFDRSRGELGSYLRLMARSRALDLWRERQAAGRASDRLKIVAARDESRPEQRPALVAERGPATAPRCAPPCASCPRQQREAIVLAYWGGLTAEEIASQAGVPLGTAKSRLRLGMAKLRGQFAVA